MRVWSGLVAAMVLSATAALAPAVVVGVAWTRLSSAGHIHPAGAAPAAPVAIVFGAQLGDGRPLAVLRNRLDTTVRLYRSGVVGQVLVSGDAGGGSGDETAAMSAYLAAAGVPASAMRVDGLGLDTHLTCRRAAGLFGVTRALLVTQRFHLARAVALCRASGIDADGVDAGCAGCSRLRFAWGTVRDWLATPKAVLEVLTDGMSYPWSSLGAVVAKAEVLTRRELNRATLDRQLLLSRSDMSVMQALTRVVGMQAQAPNPPYYGLWARLEGFHQDDLIALVQQREAVRISLMRSTIHLVTAEDCLFLRPLLQEMYERWFASAYRQRTEGVDVPGVLKAGVKLVEAEPLTFAVLGKRLADQFGGADEHTLGMVVRMFAPLVQVPPRGLWGFSGQAAHTTAQVWLGRELRTDATLDEMVLRYLGGFGPASVKDAQVWSGLTRLKEVFERLRPQLVTFRDEQGVELFDLPDAPRPGGDVQAPVRLVAEFENMLLSYADRSRIISEEHRKRIFTKNGLIPATFLLDGVVAGVWRLERVKKAVTLELTAFGKVSKRDKAALQAEGESVLAFAAPEATSTDIRII